MKRLQHLSQLPKEWAGIDRLVNRYEAILACPFPGYYDGHLMDMDFSKSITLGLWLENHVQLLEQDVFNLQSELRDKILNGSLSRQDPAIEPLMSSTYLHLITMRLLSCQHKAYTDLAAMKPSEITDQHYARIPAVTADCDLKELAQHTVEDCRAFCVEKHGEAPEVVVSTSPRGFDGKPEGSAALDSLVIEGQPSPPAAASRHPAPSPSRPAPDRQRPAAPAAQGTCTSS